jgi:hypothetical protein
MNRTCTFREGSHPSPVSRQRHVTLDLDALTRHRQRQLDVRGLAATLECILGAVGGYGYAALLGQRPSLSNTEALRAFVETHVGEDGELPDLVTLSRQVRRALDRAEQARDEI